MSKIKICDRLTKLKKELQVLLDLLCVLSVQWPTPALPVSSNWHQTTLQSESETGHGRHAGIVILFLYSVHSLTLKETVVVIVF